ncbi:ORF6N domain-containing protein [Massilia scottii]|uniref:ORF6N domain-containing protein n=1 Tax=Massilia scottii TaxID=3057166 RepID=UPI00279655F1|nr:ORF6N domain-containing protein [Massilia sp. CCM 9029]MDQ1831949.1 ORF6N domain-containing protein [Massilia sp. CCM 9029]
MNSLVTVGDIMGQVLIHQSIPVCTTKQLASFYHCDQESIQKNYERNAERFEEGRHFVKLTGPQLKKFKNDLPTESRLVEPRAPSLMLWTEKGALRHAKILSTDKAWEVFEQLEESYFREVGMQVNENETCTLRERIPLLLAAVHALDRHGFSLPSTYRAINRAAGSQHFRSMTVGQLQRVEPIARRIVSSTDTQADWAALATVDGTQNRLTGF